MKRGWIILAASILLVLYTMVELITGAGMESVFTSLVVLLILWLLRDGTSIGDTPRPADAEAGRNSGQHGQNPRQTAPAQESELEAEVAYTEAANPGERGEPLIPETYPTISHETAASLPELAEPLDSGREG